MAVQIQTPNITGGTDREKLQQIQSYLYRMAQQLQWAFDNISTAGGSSDARLPGQTARESAGKEQAESNFRDIKDLIIKSADIVNAYYAQITRRLEGVYVAQSEFGTYTQKTDLTVEENSTNITQLFTNYQIISDTLEDIKDRTVDTNAYLKTGLLEERADGIPVYGLEIGQTNSVDGTTVFDKFARFASDRLSFFDSNDTEVAYISDYKLCITNAEISGSLLLSGKFKLYFNGGLAFQWIGGDA
jgi:hypothetical protein